MTNSSITTILSVPLNVLLLFLLFFVFVALVVLVGVVIQFGARLRYLASPIYDRIIKEAQEKAEEIMHDVQREARAVKERAEAEAAKAFADRNKVDEEMRKEQSKHIEMLTAHAQELLNKQTVTISQLSETMASDFSKQARAAGKALEDETVEMKKTITAETEHMKETFMKMGVKVDEDYHELVAQTKKKMEEELDGEVSSAREAVKAYRVERIKLLNKEIVGLVEDTARIALRRSLSLDQHRDIIIAALEEAKQQGLFSKNV